MKYLTLDIDFWNRHEIIDFHFIRTLYNTAPVTVYENHHAILPEINENINGWDEIINIDYHSDYADIYTSGLFNCGTWVNFVDFRNKFSWYHPHKDRYQLDLGYCHGRNQDNPFYHGSHYNKSRKVKIDQPHKVNLKGVEKISIITSPDWSEKHILDQFMEFCDINKISINRNNPKEVENKKIPINKAI